MTVCKRIGAWLLTLVLLVSALPYTAFAASEDSHVVNATMEETSVEDIASNVTTQLLRGAKTKNETLSMEAKPTHEDSDPVEIIVVVDDSVAKPAAQAQVQSLLQKQGRLRPPCPVPSGRRWSRSVSTRRCSTASPPL